MKVGLIGNGYWGKILGAKLKDFCHLEFIQTRKNYDKTVFDDVDWIFVSTPASTHYEIVKDCIKSNVHVFVEKPFCSTLNEAEELVSLAKQHQVNLYIDNVFLFRKELEAIKKSDYIRIIYKWHKDGPFTDTLLNDLLYHDLYILISLLGYRGIEKLEFQINEENRLKCSFNYGHSEVEIDYDRTKSGEKIKIIYLDDQVIELRKTDDDPLMKLIKKCLDGSVDFESNKILNLQTTALFEKNKNQSISFKTNHYEFKE